MARPTAKKVKKVNEIEELKKCIQSDQEKLAKAYDKQIEKLKKQIAGLSTKKDKAKEKAAKNKAAGKKTAAKSTFTGDNELAVAKEELTNLESGLKKYKAEQKVLAQFEKEWVKKEKKTTKKGKSTVKAKKGTKRTKTNAAKHTAARGSSSTQENS